MRSYSWNPHISPLSFLLLLFTINKPQSTRTGGEQLFSFIIIQLKMTCISPKPCFLAAVSADKYCIQGCDAHSWHPHFIFSPVGLASDLRCNIDLPNQRSAHYSSPSALSPGLCSGANADYRDIWGLFCSLRGGNDHRQPHPSLTRGATSVPPRVSLSGDPSEPGPYQICGCYIDCTSIIDAMCKKKNGSLHQHALDPQRHCLVKWLVGVTLDSLCARVTSITQRFYDRWV